jgi:hypothetical protein
VQNAAENIIHLAGKIAVQPGAGRPAYLSLGTQGVCGAVIAKYRKNGCGFRARSRSIPTALSASVGSTSGNTKPGAIGPGLQNTPRGSFLPSVFETGLSTTRSFSK